MEKTGDNVDTTACKSSQLSPTASHTFRLIGLLIKFLKHDIIFFIIFKPFGLKFILLPKVKPLRIQF